MLRWMCAIKTTDVINTQDLRLKLGIDDLDVALRRKRLRWFGHVQWSTSWIGRVYFLDVGGRRSRGRPRKTCYEVLRNDLKLSGLRVEEQNKNHATSHPWTSGSVTLMDSECVCVKNNFASKWHCFVLPVELSTSLTTHLAALIQLKGLPKPWFSQK